MKKDADDDDDPSGKVCTTRVNGSQSNGEKIKIRHVVESNTSMCYE